MTLLRFISLTVTSPPSVGHVQDENQRNLISNKLQYLYKHDIHNAYCPRKVTNYSVFTYKLKANKASDY